MAIEVEVVEEAEADEHLREAYPRVAAARGRVTNILKIHSLHPEAMTSHLMLYRELMFGRSDLSRREREILAVVVSVANACHYCMRRSATIRCLPRSLCGRRSKESIRSRFMSKRAG